MVSVELGIGGLDHATKLGAGTSAVVYRARQVDLDREVAVKILSGTDDAFVRQFNQETKALGKLGQHPNVVTVYDTGLTDDGQPYLILELCQSSAFTRLKDGPLKPAAAAVAAAQVADGLSEAHENGIVHGDVRPGNILIGQTGRYVVTDFGLGPAGGVNGADSNKPPSGYGAPETIADGTISPASDVFSLGAVLFHMATGRKPDLDLGDSAEDANNRLIDEFKKKDLPAELGGIVASAMSRKADDRPTAAELRDQLLTIAAAEHGRGGPTTTNGERFSMAEPALAGSTVVVGEIASTTAAIPSSPPNMAKGSGWLVAPAPKPAVEDGSETSVLEAEASLSGIGLGEQRALPTRIEERPRRPLLLILAAAGLFVLIGGASYLLLSQGGDQSIENEEAVNVETVDGPETSIDATGNEATNRTGSGAVGSLGPGSDTTVSGFDDTAPTTATTTRPAQTVPVVSVPNVVAFGANDAEGQLVALGFAVTRINEPSATRPVGEVIRQNPAAGTRLETGETVTLVVASAPPVQNVTIPAAIVGQSESDAKATLTAAGLTNQGQTITEPSDTVPAGVVIRSTPAAGTEIPDSTLVALVVSGGPAPDCAAAIGLTEAAASAPFTAAGMTVTAVQADHVVTQVGDVIACAITGNTATLQISRGPIADLCTQAAGKQVAGFESTLTAAGYTVTSTPSAVAAGPEGSITGCTVTGVSVALTYVAPDAPQTCPVVAGLVEAEARTAAITAGFTDVTTTTRSSETVPTGVVISCSVTGTVANLVVSSGPQTADFSMPDVVGDTQQAATNSLTTLGLVVSTTTAASTEPAGTVLSSSPAAGAAVAVGTAVTLEISTGPDLAIVPDVEGLRSTRATSVLQSAGFAVATQIEPTNDPDMVGRVLRSSPAAGTQIAAGTEITIFVGSQN